ncbi:sulfite exporter TauE/SafE family protein [Pseudosulfitobacter koreensis]|uniref:Probable membrane transporter protein n=1 Tax=Pseudosulfitobacter koreensis TaxID=2968472 RepID=A0ABT1YVN2_9RHOB|nr:sulfite exporter TauE/SafE family protein [Pseudosulfitobacter koreense]MCR8824937.1 sulfite exporter TauE/SafE family protein [Pseudosulfitobacter koreense]
MDILLTLLTPLQFGLALGIALLAGFVKGVVGFAMPMIFVSGLSTFLAPDLALAMLLLPTLATNGVQALRQGPRAAWASITKFRTYMIVGGIVLVLSAQLVSVLPMQVMLLIIGVPVTGFALMQIVGWTLKLNGQSTVFEVVIGTVAGFLGGISGIWGPPTVMYLTALGTEKHEQMRAQGVIYGLGAVSLVGAHVGSGVLNAATWPLSAAMVVPALLGMVCGSRVMDRIDQVLFRRATLFVLLVAGVNLVRRALVE